MKNLKTSISDALELVLAMDGEIRKQTEKRPFSHEIGQVVCFSIPNLTDSIPAIIHARHENRNGNRYDVIIHYPEYSEDELQKTWFEMRLYNVNEKYLDGFVRTSTDQWIQGENNNSNDC